MKSVFLAALLISTTAMGMSGKGEGHQHHEKFKKELNLTAEQEAKFDAMKNNHEEGRKLRQKFKESKKEFHKLMSDPKATNAQLKEKFEAYMKLQEESHRKRFEDMLARRAILTPEQLVKLEELRKEHPRRERGPRGKDRGPRGKDRE